MSGCGPNKYCTGMFIVQTDGFVDAYVNEAKEFETDNDVSFWRFSWNFNSTGLYCLAVETNTPDEGTAIDFELIASFEAWYGKLPGADFPKLGLFLGLSITYLVIGAIWFVRSWMFWRDILQLQHFISGVTFFLMVEMAFNYAYFEEYNLAGEPNSFLLVMVVVLNAARNSISFFMLLIVSLGYGVVKPTLGANMSKCLVLTAVHFLAGVLYGAGSLVINKISAPVALLFSLPLSFAMTAFYYSILYALSNTMQGLEERRQPIKLLMYKRLWAILVFSAVSLFVFFVINTIALKFSSDDDWIPVYWQYRWLLLDGFLNILYLIVYVSIALLWRPTDNNQRYGLEQLAGDDYDDDDGSHLAATGGAPGITNPIHRKVALRAMHSNSHTDETLDEGVDGVDLDEDDDDVFKWAEENVGSSASGAGATHQPRSDVSPDGVGLLQADMYGDGSVSPPARDRQL
ncbi:hypothetical protein HDU82_004402 [Entophlyctis luteolus]|nr:hypothetical protein HDU82_004402 [Entophlyctis luteolus]